MPENEFDGILQGGKITDFEQLTQELQLIGSTNSIDYVVGLHYYDGENHSENATARTIAGPRAFEFTDSENRSLAIFGQATYSPSEQSPWHYTLGARYSKDDRKAFRVNPNSSDFLKSAPNGANYDRDFNHFDPSFTVAYDVNDTVNIYAKAVSGYKAGGTSTRSSNLTLFAKGFGLEEILSYELGLKGDFLDSRLRLNLAVFTMEIDGYQSSVITGSTPADRDFIGVEGVEVTGAEMDLQLALTENLRASLGLGLLDTSMGVDFIEVPGQPDREVIDGLAYAPDQSGTVALDYVSNLSDWDVDAHLGYSYQGERYSSLNISESNIQPSYGVVDASLSFALTTSADREIKFTLWGKNIADEDYQLVNFIGLEFLGQREQVIFGDPKTYGVTVSYKY